MHRACRCTSVDDTLALLGQIRDLWPDALLQSCETAIFRELVPISDVATLPGNSMLVYKDFESVMDRAYWIRLDVGREVLAFTVSEWGSPAALVVRSILGIDRAK